MAESLNEIIDIITGFCREHASVLMIAGAVVVVLIILIAAICVARRGKKRAAESAANAAAPAISDEPAPQTSEQPEPPAVPQTPERPEPERPPKQPQPADQHDAEKGRIENLLRDLQSFGGGGLEEVEIKIQGAEIRLRYAGNDTKVIRYETLAEKEKDMPAGENAADLTDQKVSRGGTYDPDGGEKEGIAGEDFPRDKISKFGPDNINRTRSGRVFTEEELTGKIRD
ncbi:MAG: hypothetical protein UIJ88_00455 [Anaerovoracaceae bacterium]|nr:hypothetical protein [Anaerovoracaceae bacterium]